MSLLSSSSDFSTCLNDLYSSIPSTSTSINLPPSKEDTAKDDTSKKDTEAAKKNASMKLTIILGIFLLILAVSGNFVAETMSCQTQKVMNENMYVKNAIIILIIYFSLGFASSEDNLPPTELLKQALYIWVFFLMFNKMELFFTGMVVAMLVVLLICKDYITYYSKQNDEKYKKSIDTLSRTVDSLFYGITLTTIIGFGMYFKKQHNDYFSTFSYSKFLFGTPKCSSF